MKRILGNITLAFAALLFLAGCAKPELVLPEPEESGEGLITLTLMNGNFPTRAASDLEDYERAVQHIDVIIFENGDDGKPGNWAFHARKDATNLEGQKIVLGKRSDFSDKEYWIYVIANHVSSDGSEFNQKNTPTFLSFCQKAAQNELVFLTGHSKMGEVEFPQYFLMDGVAYDSAYPPKEDADNDGEPEYSAVNLNDSRVDATKDLFLKVDLKRAAAKIVVNINEKAKDPDNEFDNYVEFTGKGTTSAPADGDNSQNLSTSGFYFRELPYSTSLIADSRYATMNVGHTVQLRNTVKYNGDRFSYATDNSKIVITAYAYARNWKDLDAIESTTIVANIPLESYEYGTMHYVDGDDVPFFTGGKDEKPTVKDDMGKDLVYRENFKVKDPTGKEIEVTGWFGWSKEVLPANYYQIPISQTKMLKRNGYYEVTVAISIPGGSEPGEPVELEPVKYEVYDWVQKTITVGNSTERPAYLALNKEEFEMYNINSDYTLEFASSEDVTVEVVNYYYYDKMGKPKYRYSYDEFGNKEDSEDVDNFKEKKIIEIHKESMSGMTQSATIDALRAKYKFLTEKEAEDLVNKYTTFTKGSYTASYSEYVELEEGDKGTPMNVRTSTEETILETLQQTYGLSETEATELFNNSNLSYNTYYGTRYYSGTITVPRKLVERTDVIDLTGKKYDDALMILGQEKYGLNNSTIENYLNSLQVSGVVKVTETEETATLIEIKVTPDLGMSGKIKIESPIPMNNTVRYIELQVRNDNGTKNDENDDITRTVVVKQYPLEYITNTQAWYSYRSDFNGTSYEKKPDSNRYVTTTSYDYNDDTWEYATSTGTWFYRSMVAVEQADGSSNIYSYSWGNNSGTTATRGNNAISGIDNGRIYHVRITASSDEYVLGAPRMTKDGITDGGIDNARMVSPSFMIASQLGAVYSDAFTSAIPNTVANAEIKRTAMAASHCKNYVEVYVNADGDKVHLHDWRLPTAAELLIIKEFQYVTNAAMDEVLAGDRYYSASGLVIVNGTSSRAIRCVRDAFKDPKQAGFPYLN